MIVRPQANPDILAVHFLVLFPRRIEPPLQPSMRPVS
jgi:hypothetical protein